MSAAIAANSQFRHDAFKAQFLNLVEKLRPMADNVVAELDGETRVVFSDDLSQPPPAFEQWFASYILPILHQKIEGKENQAVGCGCDGAADSVKV
jgi:hypothetical protein